MTLYSTLLEPLFRKKIEDHFGIALEDFSVGTQVQFLNFLFEKSEAEADRVRDFLAHGNAHDRLQSFLSLEEGGEKMGDVILEIGERLSQGAADSVFAKYVEFADASMGWTQEFSEIFREIFPFEFGIQDRLPGAFLAKSNAIFLEVKDRLHSELPIDAEKITEEIETDIRARKSLLFEMKNTMNRLKSLFDEITRKRIELNRWMIERRNKTLLLEKEEKQRVGKWDDMDEVEMKENEFMEGELFDEESWIPGKFYDEEGVASLIDEFRFFLEHGIGGKDENTSRFTEIMKKLETAKTLLRHVRYKSEELLYGRESATLPKGFLSDFENEVRHRKSEIPETDKPIYFPFGISKEWFKWKKVLDGEGQSEKPIDLYNFLFWLQSEGRPITIPLFAETQAWNYEALHGMTREESLDAARAVSRVELERYERMKKAFHLDNLEFVSSEAFLSGEKREQFERYRKLLFELSETPVWAHAFGQLVSNPLLSEKRSSPLSKEERKKFLPYALEEIAAILTIRGMKVSHPNEARYDILAALLEHLEEVAHEKMPDVDFFDVHQHEKLLPLLKDILEAIQDRLNNDPALRRSVCGQVYKSSAAQALLSVRRPILQGILTKSEKRKLAFSFLVAPTDSRSFGWRSGKAGEEQTKLSFREPYSTYFPAAGMEMLEDQVIASSEGFISGKVLTLPAKEQQEYAKSVVLPLLIHFFRVLSDMPESSSENMRETRRELLDELRRSETLGDLLRFVQKHIVKPSVGETT
ncbi:MAG: hypothetical protein IPL87_00395 [Candidatus Moraniibacteriota bacterium]|nr:MAG: hypothetical protein IPL87_00395 [Candidatus Moranbacteria bacterium]